ncbi:uncharacterized protein FTOL_13354 [Fusarium torulosum]|uniref:Uncharacterized protein n=1 Tax=Fusarium torulosum TaxID=33205 RepID=A0AAE8MMG5_9HYPO|nr:uncharacterized protein FTOL_13354 [Fusarium torulosum]
MARQIRNKSEFRG